ncbi:MAG TPA: PEGA domain-containing protein [Vicinamibacterales bacterium]
MPGLMDGFGDRLLMFDNTDSDTLEMLRFHAPLVDTPGFEEVLHERVRRLGRLTHAAFPAIRAVERLETDGSLVLVSTYAPGRRLSAFLAEPRLGKGLHPAFVTWVVSQVIQPLSILQSAGDDVAHGALTADRVILTTDGRVRIGEHVLGSALRHLDRSPAELWREFGLLVPVDHPGGARLDARADVFQLGVLALSMLLARRVTPVDLEQRLPFLLDQWSNATTTRSRLFSDPLRLWLERALQVGDRPYRSAAEAHADLRRLPSASASRAFEFLQAGDVNGFATPLVMFQSTGQTSGQEGHMANGFSLDGVQVSDSTPPTGTPPRMPESGIADRGETLQIESKSGGPGSRLLVFADSEPARSPSPSAVAARTPAVTFRSRKARLSIAVGLAAVALVEAVVIATMFVREPSASAASTAATAPPAAVVPAIQVEAPQVPAAPSVLAEAGASIPGTALDAERRNADALAATIARAANNQRSGGVRLATPIELKVLQGDRVLGSSADGPIVTTAGTHQLDLINAALGFRARRAVTFRAGEITTVTIAVPPGRISVNAEPWAEVWIDNRPVGETPLANLEIPIGEHEVVFRHPDLGERRQNIIVRAEEVARASTTFDR